MSRERAKGTAWETAIVNYLADYFDNVRRTGSADYGAGDVIGIHPNLIIEAKNAARIDLAGWIDQAETAAERNNADIAVVWVKRRGHTSPGKGYVVMSGESWLEVLHQLYGETP